MTRTLRESHLVPQDRRTGGYTRLERTVMQALARELRTEIPDLAAQFAASRPTIRRNSGFGAFTEVLVPPERSTAGPTGEFGTVHVMIAGLSDPVAFRARLRNGRLLGLLGDSYGQDTRSIDFASAVFDQVFTLDAAGRAIPAEDAVQAARPAASRAAPSIAGPPAHAPASVVIQPRPRATETAPTRASPLPERAPAAPSEDLDAGEKTSLRIGLWAGLFALGSILVLVFDVPAPFVFIAAVVAGRYFQTDRGLARLRQSMASLQQSAREPQA